MEYLFVVQWNKVLKLNHYTIYLSITINGIIFIGFWSIGCETVSHAGNKKPQTLVFLNKILEIMKLMPSDWCGKIVVCCKIFDLPYSYVKFKSKSIISSSKYFNAFKSVLIEKSPRLTGSQNKCDNTSIAWNMLTHQMTGGLKINPIGIFKYSLHSTHCTPFVIYF